MGINQEIIYGACRTDTGFGAGYLWRFEEEDMIFKKEYFGGYKRVLKIDIKTKQVLQIYKNITEAARDVGVHQSVISRVCNRKNNKKTVKGFIWRFEDDNEFANENINNETNSMQDM